MKVKDDDGVTLDGIVCFNPEIEKLIGRKVDEFLYDSEPRTLFEDTFGTRINVRLTATKVDFCTSNSSVECSYKVLFATTLNRIVRMSGSSQKHILTLPIYPSLTPTDYLPTGKEEFEIP